MFSYSVGLPANRLQRLFPCSELLVSQHSQILASAVATSNAIDMAQRENKTGNKNDAGISAKYWSLSERSLGSVN